MLAKVYTAAIVGIETRLVEVEVDVQMQGLPSWNMVGLLETAVKEARDRVLPAIRNSGLQLPNRRTIVNLSPATVKKSGAHFDLPIAIGMLKAWGIAEQKDERRSLFGGELSLTGKLLPIHGTLLLAMTALDNKLDSVIVPEENADEARLVSGLEVIGLGSLSQVVDFLAGRFTPKRSHQRRQQRPQKPSLDFADVRGQAVAKRGLEIAAAGSHNVLLAGPPGVGKSMLAERIPSILPPLTREEHLETMKVLSLHGLLDQSDVARRDRPFRAPHHSASAAGLIGGGGSTPKLGEISLAHNGVLFLDEIAEFRKDLLEALRQPLESGAVRIVRAGTSVTYPAKFMLIGAMNPCRCGYYGHPKKACICSMNHIQSYRQKISGPIIDRIDIHIELMSLPHAALLEGAPGEPSAKIRERVLLARERQLERLGPEIGANARIPPKLLPKWCSFKGNAADLLQQATDRLSLSARAVHRVLKIARTIADLESSADIGAPHIAEALQFRPMDHPL